MNRIGIIENGIVINVIDGNQEFASNYEGIAIILDDNEVGIGYTYNGSTFSAPVKSQEQKEIDARYWRNLEIKTTDFIVPLTDFPRHADWIIYRQQLRDWPTTSDFPETKPTAPAELN